VLGAVVVMMTLAACSSGPAGGDAASGGTATGGTATGAASTGETATGESSPGSAEGAWTLVAGRGPGGALRLVDGRPVTLTVTGHEVRGRAACNSYSGTATRDGDAFLPGAIARTQVACADDAVMALESAYFAALTTVTTATGTGDRLVLRGSAAELTFTRRAPVAQAAVEGTRWNLDTLIDGERASTTLGAAFLLLDGSGGLTGNGGCLDLAGRYRLEGATLTMSGLRLVEQPAADCGPEPAAQDARVMAVLRGPVAVEVDSRRLTLTSGSLGLGFAAATGD
jgi:heat shock protein HslJ